LDANPSLLKKLFISPFTSAAAGRDNPSKKPPASAAL
jgi:hypothetical protein